MAKLGFLGLGIMGGPMARHLVMGGHDVAVWSHNQSKAKQFADSVGASFCATPTEVAQNSECAFLCVGNTAMSREVILGEQGLDIEDLPGQVPGQRPHRHPGQRARLGPPLGHRRVADQARRSRGRRQVSLRRRAHPCPPVLVSSGIRPIVPKPGRGASCDKQAG